MSPPATLGRSEVDLAVPTNSVLFPPAGAVVLERGSRLAAEIFEPALVRLKPSVTAFRGKQLVDPSDERLRQYQADELRSLIVQAQSLTEKYPSSATAWARLAQAFASAGQTDEAVSAARRVFDCAEAEIDRAAWLVGARILASAGHRSEAERHLGLLASSPGPWSCLYAAIAGDREDYGQALARLADVPGEEAAALRGYFYLKVLNWQAAIRELRAAGGEGSGSPGLLSNLSYAYAAVGSSRKAMRAARQAVSLAPRSHTLSFNLVALLLALGRASEGRAELDRVRRHVGDDAKVLTARAQTFLAQGLDLEAERDMRRAVQIERFNRDTTAYIEASANLALIECRLGKKSRSQALTVIRRGLSDAEQPPVTLALMLADLDTRRSVTQELERLYERLSQTLSSQELLPLRVRILQRKQEYPAALEVCREWVKAFPLDPNPPQFFMSIAGHALGDFDEAIRIGKEALRRMPGNGLLVNNLAFCMGISGRLQEASDLLASSPLDSPYLFATRGLVALAEGRVTEGTEWYQRAIQQAKLSFKDEAERREFELMARAYELVVMFRFGIESLPAPAVKLPEDWRNDNRYNMIAMLAERVGALARLESGLSADR